MKRLLLAAALALFALPALSQTVTLTPSVTSGNGSLSTRLTWATTPAASSCSASGHTSWTGAKAASGAQDLPPITLSGSYTLTLACTWPGETTATVNWIAPTQNTDGSSLAKCTAPSPNGSCLAGFRVFRRVGTNDMNGAEMTPVDNPNATSLSFPGLVAGTHYFGVEAVNGSGTPSAMSNISSKVITATASRTASVTVTVNPKPSPPTGLSVE